MVGFVIICGLIPHLYQGLVVAGVILIGWTFNGPDLFILMLAGVIDLTSPGITFTG